METTGDIVCDGNAYYSSVNGISAAGTTQGTATAILADVNNVTTVAAGSGVILTTTNVGSYITVLNSGVNPLLVYPPVGGNIDGQATNAPISIPVSQVWSGSAVAALTWETLVSPVFPTTNQTTVTYSGGSIVIGIANNPVFPGTGSLTVPVGTTAQRPGSPTVGMMRYNSTTGYYEVYDTSWVTYSGVLDKSTVNVVQSGTTAANMFSYSVPANTLGTGGVIRAFLAGIWNSGGAGRTATITINYGGTPLWVGTSGTLASGLTVGWSMELYLVANNSATAQTLSGTIRIGTTGSPTTGTGVIANTTTTPFTIGMIGGTSAINSANANTFTVSVAQNGTGTWTKYFHTLEIL